MLREYHQIIQDAHKINKPWINPNLKKGIKKIYFSIYILWILKQHGQVVPIVLGTSPYYPLPFQWSVHKWESKIKK